jgi:hypothetical protein
MEILLAVKEDTYGSTTYALELIYYSASQMNL